MKNALQHPNMPVQGYRVSALGNEMNKAKTQKKKKQKKNPQLNSKSDFFLAA